MNGEDEKYRSRKWILAQKTFLWANINHGVLQILILIAMWFRKLDGPTWAGASHDLAMVWVAAMAFCLGLYGLQNVLAIKFRGSGEIS
jgi:hypothetical protein